MESVAVYTNYIQKLKDLINLSSSLCNFHLFASNIKGNVRHRKLRNVWVAKTFMSDTFFVKFPVF